MSEMHTSIHDLPGGGIMVRCEQDLSYLVDEYAERIQRNVDAAALDKAAGVLAEFGYVKVVRCRDCKYMFDWAYDRMLCKMWADGGMDDDAKNVLYPTVKPDGFCAWGKRRSDA